MAEDMTPEPEMSDITPDDRLWAAIGYPIPILAILVLLMEEKKQRRFLKFHAVQSLIFNVAIWVVIVVFSTVTLGFGGLCAPLIWLAVLWPAYDSYKGNYTEIPVVSNFIRNQNWA